MGIGHIHPVPIGKEASNSFIVPVSGGVEKRFGGEQRRRARHRQKDGNVGMVVLDGRCEGSHALTVGQARVGPIAQEELDHVGVSSPGGPEECRFSALVGLIHAGAETQKWATAGTSPRPAASTRESARAVPWKSVTEIRTIRPSGQRMF